LFVHYGDLKADPEAEMRRIAAFCDVTVEADAWPALVEAVGLEAMRDEARGTEDPMAGAFEGGAARFFYKGSNGRWRSVLTDDELDMYEAAAASLDPALRTWLEGGRHAAVG
jgi:aryl sulfotransferase